MKTLKTLILSIALAVGTAMPALAAIPWGSTAPLEVSGATPTCTYTATALACIEDMTANVTAVTLAGMTAGTTYTIIFMQDGTGSRTLAASGGGSITGAPSLITTTETGANKYAVWIIKATSASAATFVADYPNAPLWDTFMATLTTAGTAITTKATQTQTAIVVPGMSTANSCYWTPQTAVDSTWAGTAIAQCIPATNSVNIALTNPTATTATPSATVLNIRIAK
jgi:hypothetical protein